VQFRVVQDAYQGPLDLLLRLALERDLPLGEISLAAIARDYRRELGQSRDVPLGEVGDFAVLQARLLHLKAGWRRHVAEELEEAEAVAAAAGVGQEMAAAVAFLRSHMREPLFARQVARPLAACDPAELFAAWQRINRRARVLGRRARLRPKPQIPFRRVLHALRRELRKEGRLRIAAPGRSRPEAVLELLGALELTRLGEAGIEQEHLQAPLYLVGREEADDGELAGD
jgi:chromatin segregation and condensation protein Rec8/ScpA/Scc1 (kleisin family)